MKNKFPMMLFAALIALLLSTSISYAQSFEVKVSPVKDKITIEEEGIFNITIRNNLETKETFRIRNFDYPTWDMRTIPLANPMTLAVGPKSEGAVQIYVRSLNTQRTPIGTYSVTARIDLERKEESEDIPLTVAIISTKSLIKGVIPNVKSSLTHPKKVDPRQPFKLDISLKNFNPIEYESIKLRLSGNLINEEIETSLAPAGEPAISEQSSEKSFVIEKVFEPFTKPQEDTLHLEVYYNERLLDSKASSLEIIEYVDKQQISEEKLILKSIKRFKVTSNNPGYRGDLKTETSSFKKLFTSTHPKAGIISEDDKLYFVWQVDLSGQNEAEVAITENYRPLVVIIAVIIICLALYFTFRSPVVVKKEVAGIYKIQGGISHMKIMIKVKNRGRVEISDVEVNDTIPSIAELEEDLSVGSLKPVKTAKKGHHAIAIKWRLEKLVAGDERVLSYKFRLRLPIVGEYSLSSASAHYQSGRRHFVSNSNRAVAGS